MYNTIIFDLDGTLLNTLKDLWVSTNYALMSNGFPERTMEEVRCFVGNGIRTLIKRALPYPVTDEVFEKIFVDFKAHYKVHCNDFTGPYEGIMELLKTLKDRGYTMGIASNKLAPAVEQLRKEFFGEYIFKAVGVVTGQPPKPDTYMVDKLMDMLDADKEHTLYVGDSQVDVETARNAGLDMVTVLWGFRDREELEVAGAMNFINSPMELLDYLD